MKPRSGINKKQPSMVPPDFVNSKAEIRQSLLNFNAGPGIDKNRRETLLRQTSYWVFDGKSQTFGPSKFVGFVDMTFPIYEDGIKGRWEIKRFYGGGTKKAIERALNKKFARDPKLSVDLEDWGTRISHEKVFNGVDHGKWQFITL